MAETITITIATIRNDIKRHLSIIGKRLHNNDGKNLFSNVTLSSAEENEILGQYISASAQDIQSVLKPLVTNTTEDASAITITIENKRGDADFVTRCKKMFESYVTLNSTGEYLAMTHPDLSQKYQRDAEQRMEAIVMYAFAKCSPKESAYSYASVNGQLMDLPPYQGQDGVNVVYVGRVTISLQQDGTFTIDNPIVCLRNGNISVVDGEDTTDGKLWSYDLYHFQPIATTEENEHLVTAILTTVSGTLKDFYHQDFAHEAFSESYEKLTKGDVACYIKQEEL